MRYKTELAAPHRRKTIKALKLRESLGQTKGGIYAPFPLKPKWMRWKTYWRIRDEGEALEREINAETVKWMKSMGVRFVPENAKEADDVFKGYEF